MSVKNLLSRLQAKQQKKSEESAGAEELFEKVQKEGIISQTNASITFTVNRVGGKKTLLSPVDAEIIVEHRCGGIKPEAFSPFTRDIIAEKKGFDKLAIDNALISALDLCWNNHYPLILTPDVIWLCIAQGFAKHVNANAEKLRDKLVEHEGKKTLTVNCAGFQKGSPKNPWPQVFEQFSEQIRHNVGDKVHAMLTPNFSTTGPVEKAASQVVLMNCFQQYFEYKCYLICGIPSITLEGTVQDWKILKEKVLSLAEYDVKWWIEAMTPVLDQFIATASGNVNYEFWKKIYHMRGGGAYKPGPFVTGWILSFFPYYRTQGDMCVKNEYLNLWKQVTPANHTNDQDNRGFLCSQFTEGVVSTPFKAVDVMKGIEYPMQFFAGFMAVSQDFDTKSIRPEIGWAVADEEKMNETIEIRKAGNRWFNIKKK